MNHTAPDHMQTEPHDTTEIDVQAQVATWSASGVLVHTSVATEIASWWQSPDRQGMRFASFASSGTIVDGLAEEIERTIGLWQADKVRPRPILATGDHDQSIAELRALTAYVKAATVTVWAVGTYRQIDRFTRADGTITALRLDYADAVNALRDLIESAPDALLPQGDKDCDCDDRETCEYHTIEEEATAAISSLPWIIAPAVARPQPHQGQPRPLSITFHPASAVQGTTYALEPTTMTYAGYLSRPESSRD